MHLPWKIHYTWHIYLCLLQNWHMYFSIWANVEEKVFILYMILKKMPYKGIEKSELCYA